MPKIDEREAVPTSRWSNKRVTIAVFEGGKQASLAVDAQVVGLLAVHPGLCQHAGRWSVSALTVGDRVVTAQSLEDAKRIAAFLWHRLAACWRLRDREDMLRAVRDASPGVEYWIKDCQEQLKWLDPKEYGLT